MGSALKKQKKKKYVKKHNHVEAKQYVTKQPQIIEEIKEGKKYLEKMKTEIWQSQKLWDTGHEVVRGKFIAIQAYLRKQEKSQMNNLALYLKQLEKNKQNPMLVEGK